MRMILAVLSGLLAAVSGGLAGASLHDGNLKHTLIYGAASVVAIAVGMFVSREERETR